MSPIANVILFLALVVFGLLIESWISDVHYRLTKRHLKENHFSLGKYFFLISFPLVSVLVLSLTHAASVLSIFLLFSIIGPVLEWLIGFYYHKVVGQRLWTYHRYHLTRYTSWLTIPIWGFGGVLFYLLASAFALG